MASKLTFFPKYYINLTKYNRNINVYIYIFNSRILDNSKLVNKSETTCKRYIMRA